MKIVLKNEIAHFMENQESPCISIYMDTFQAGSETRQNPVKLKNHLKEADKQLQSFKLPDEARNRILQPARRLLEDYDFWQHQHQGLALFISPKGARHYHLPFPVKESTVVANAFHLKPLMPLYTRDDQFFLLSLDQKHVHLYEGNRYSIREKPVPELPKSLAEALQYDDFEPLLNFHVAGPTGAGAGQQSPVYHGQGGEKDQRRDQLLRFFREIDKALHEYLRESRKPLILSGVDYYFPIYQEASSYPHLVKKGIKRNSENMTERELHSKAWELVDQLFREEQNRAAERYKKLAMADSDSGKIKTADQFEDVIPAAFQGRVDTLFALRDHRQWGTFDERTLEVETDGKDSLDRKDLLDLAALYTIQHNGRVFLVSPENMPEDSSLAAILRF